MEMLNQILDTVKHSSNPEMYYFAAAMLLVMVFYFVSKLLKIAIMVLLIGMVGYGFSYMQGKDPKEVLKNFTDSVTSLTSSISSSVGSSAKNTIVNEVNQVTGNK